jgi:GDP-mannose 6-dehydrogenase
MRVSVFGLGYVGSVTAACLARAGHDVIGVDIDRQKTAMVNLATPPVIEPGLEEVFREVVGKGRLTATTSGAEATRASDIALICVGTPGLGNGQTNVSSLLQVAAEIGRGLRTFPKRYTVAVRSTVLPGTTEEVFIPTLLAAAGPRLAAAISVAVNPEFMREGASVADFGAPAVTVVGSRSAPAAEFLRSLYAWIEAPFVHTDIRTAEMVKYAANAFHALKVCFANEVGDVATALGADAHEVMRIFLMDKKLNVSSAYLEPGFAFGGSCLPKDLRALLNGARKANVSVPLLSTILPSNRRQIEGAVAQVLATRKRRIGVIGLSFKPETDDLRESPMVTLVKALIDHACEVRILDPNVSMARVIGANRRAIQDKIPNVASIMCDTVPSLLRHAEVLVIGARTPEADDALAKVRSGQLVVDLTRRTRPPLAAHAVTKRPARMKTPLDHPRAG